MLVYSSKIKEEAKDTFVRIEPNLKEWLKDTCLNIGASSCTAYHRRRKTIRFRKSDEFLLPDTSTFLDEDTNNVSPIEIRNSAPEVSVPNEKVRKISIGQRRRLKKACDNLGSYYVYNGKGTILFLTLTLPSKLTEEEEGNLPKFRNCIHQHLLHNKSPGKGEYRGTLVSNPILLSLRDTNILNIMFS